MGDQANPVTNVHALADKVEVMPDLAALVGSELGITKQTPLEAAERSLGDLARQWLRCLSDAFKVSQTLHDPTVVAKHWVNVQNARTL